METRLSVPQINPKEDILSKFLQSQSIHPNILSIDDVKAEVLIMMIAAPDTTSALICSVVNYIIQNQKVYDRLMSELETLESEGHLSSRVVSYDDVQCMIYLSACVQETSRLSPPIPAIIPRRVSMGGTTLNGIYIPEGAEIGASPPVINNDETIFGPETNLFKPERWIGDPERVLTMKKYLFSWGWGSRKCVAKHLSLMKTLKFCAQLFRDFHVSSVSPDKPWSRREDKGFTIHEDQYLLFQRRTPAIRKTVVPEIGSNQI